MKRKISYPKNTGQASEIGQEKCFEEKRKIY